MIQLYVDVIIYPYPTPNASVVSLSVKETLRIMQAVRPLFCFLVVW